MPLRGFFLMGTRGERAPAPAKMPTLTTDVRGRSDGAAFHGGEVTFRQSEGACLEEPSHDLSAPGTWDQVKEGQFSGGNGRAEPLSAEVT